MLDHAKKLEFVHKMAKLGLQHFDIGGTVGNAGVSGYGYTESGQIAGGVQSAGQTVAGNVGSSVGGAVQGIASDLTTQNNFKATAPDISQQEGYYTGANEGQIALEQQLQAQANGAGPNPALAQLNQATNANGNKAAGLVASQRGLNPGEAARLGSQAQVAANQNAAGQAATLSAQQQLAAQGNLANVYNQQANEASTNAGVVGGQQISAQGINAQVAQNNTNAVNQTEGGILGAAGQAFGLLAKGGEVKKMALGGGVGTTKGGSISVPGVPNFSNASETSGSPTSGDSSDGPQSSAGKWLSAPNSLSPTSATSSNNFGASGLTMPSLGSSAGFAKGGKVQQGLMKSGGKVDPTDPKEKATVKGDSYKNDTVPAMLSQGEIVIPRHITQGPKAPEKAAAFVRAVLAKKGLGKSA